jgi:acetyltransferase-like isoleucine patch superfamily enzyme
MLKMKKISKLIKVFKGKVLFLINPIAYLRGLGVKIGDGCRIATANFGSEPYLIEIGNRCHITKGVKFINHDGGVWVFRDRADSFDVFGKIKIGNNVYIGNDCTLMPGVEIGNNCVIGASTIVTKSIPDNSVVAGVPARYICNIEDYYLRMRERNFNTKKMSNHQKKKYILSVIEEKGIKKDFLRY